MGEQKGPVYGNRAKFVCIGIEKVIGYGADKFLYTCRFSAVVGGSPENKEFFAATPSGDLKMTVRSPMFEVGKQYFLDFTPAE